MCLAITLYFSERAEVLDGALTYFIACGTVYSILHSTVRMLYKFLQFLHLCRSPQDFIKAGRVFKISKSQVNSVDGCIRASDVICNEMKQPPRNRNPVSFFSRKGYFAIPAQPPFDSNHVLLYASGKCGGGATHDALANAVSDFMKEVEIVLLGEYFWLWAAGLILFQSI